MGAKGDLCATDIGRGGGNTRRVDEGRFLGYSLTWHKTPKLKIASTSRKRLEDKIREVFKGARGRSLTTVITKLNPILRGWMAYFKLTETRKGLEEERAFRSAFSQREPHEPGLPEVLL